MREKNTIVTFFIKHIIICQRSYKKQHKETLGEPEKVSAESESLYLGKEFCSF